jgi:hypothetical protein
MAGTAVIHQIEDTASVEVTIKKADPIINANKRSHLAVAKDKKTQ